MFPVPAGPNIVGPASGSPSSSSNLRLQVTNSPDPGLDQVLCEKNGHDYESASPLPRATTVHFLEFHSQMKPREEHRDILCSPRGHHSQIYGLPRQLSSESPHVRAALQGVLSAASVDAIDDIFHVAIPGPHHLPKTVVTKEPGGGFLHLPRTGA
eukprot:TRINITY_DN389_c0_g1_i2.p1 TRINITY_DN389_c0_g1~~TRINITY_DN389_c0_g1_i2.p1  ORF type:complete len:155 (+),score=13.29 TRINITY_DN389_c0_g1_i2:585-1049(+)